METHTLQNFQQLHDVYTINFVIFNKVSGSVRLGRQAKNVSCSSLSLERTSVHSITWISWTNVSCYKSVTDDNFVFQQDSASVHYVHNHVQLPQCKILNFLFPELQRPTAQSQTPFITRFKQLYSSANTVLNHQDWRNPAATGWSLA